MNASELNTELAKVIQRGIKEGFLNQKMTICEIVGIIELQKLDLVRWAQNMMQAQAAAQAPIILPSPINGRHMPPPPGQ